MPVKENSLLHRAYSTPQLCFALCSHTERQAQEDVSDLALWGETKKKGRSEKGLWTAMQGGYDLIYLQGPMNLSTC